MGFRSSAIPKSKSPETDTLDLGALEEEFFGSLEIEENGSHFVCTVSPWGEIFWSFFTDIQWAMICEIAHMEGKEVEKAVEEVMLEKLTRMKEELGEG